MPRDPFARAGWYTWGIVALLLVLVPSACHFTKADETRADGQAAAEDVRCADGWCLVKQDTLKTLVTGIQQLDAKVRELEGFCGWRKP